jgi:hypothetical protein
MTSPLDAGTPLPALWAKDLDGNAVDITESVAGKWTAVLLYRGHW